MALEIQNVTLANITRIANLTNGDPTELMLNMNYEIYGGWFFFIMLCVLGFIMFRMAQHKQDQPLINLMYVSTGLTIISFFFRAWSITKYGLLYAAINDFQMWIFPLIMACTAAINKYISNHS